MTGTQKLWVAVLGILVVGALAAFLFKLVIPPPPPYDEQVAACYALLPMDRRAGLTVEFGETGPPKVVLAGEVGAPNVPTSEQINGFIECLREVFGEVDLAATARQPAAPLGELADTWNAQNGLKLRLMPGGNDQVLNNLRIGPSVGSKAEIMAHWCKASSGCVTCEPSEPTDDTPEILIRLTASPNASKIQMPGTWPPPVIDPVTGKPNTKPWQLVESDGRRYFYECQG